MADTTEFTGTQQTQQGTGLIPQAGQFLSNVQQIANQPSVQRSLPAIIAVVVLALGLFVYSLLQQPERTTLYASLPDAEKSKVQDALKNMGVDVSLDPTTGEILVPVEDSLCLSVFCQMKKSYRIVRETTCKNHVT
jgi:flagellar M-ring protein FliF